MLSQLRKMGLSSNVLYTLGFGSIGLSFAAWAVSLKAEAAEIDRADRWGIFVGHWAPTFFALGTAMRLEEQWGVRGRHEDTERRAADAREAMRVG
ncbi:hypothetical protein [Actinomadura roseirufa]|uniref:hypothetical protein n=1 Tax=Actinomadura roseirufa TaxID=2094049 RepID=UPI0010416D76|nr:hypothetical protein [Actinomadura roseirufa]